MNSSVAICSYNGEKYIAQQLSSILAQSKPVDEIVFCDDNSTDSTLMIAANILKGASVEVKIIKNEINRGALYSFEKCIEQCSSDIIFLSDQDDEWLPTKVETFCSIFDKNASTLALFSNGNLINDFGDVLPSDLWAKWGFNELRQQQWLDNAFASSELVHNRNVITGATLAFRKRLVPMLLPFQLPATYWHDSWIGIVAAGLGGLKFIPECTINYRVHTSQQVGLSGGASDKKHDHIPKEEYIEKLMGMFPAHKSALKISRDSLLTMLLKFFKQRN